MTLRTAFVLMVLFSISLLLRADTLVLKDGRKLEGEVLEETDTLVKFQMKGGVVSFKKEEVASVTKGGGTGGPAGVKPADKVAGAEIPRADRRSATGNAALDEARKRAAAAREKLARLVRNIASGTGSAQNIVKEYENLSKKVQEREPKIDELRQRMNNADAKYNEWVARYNGEAAQGRVSDATQRSTNKAESEAKSARSAFNSLVSTHNADVDRLNKMKENFGNGQEKIESGSEELVKALREADEACVSLCEAERRAGIVPAEAGAVADPGAGGDAGMTVETAATVWPPTADLAGDRNAWAGRRVAFEARLGALDAAAHSLKVSVGDDPDPAKWSREISVTLTAVLEAPAGQHAVLEGTVSAAAGHPIEIDRIVTLK